MIVRPFIGFIVEYTERVDTVIAASLFKGKRGNVMNAYRLRDNMMSYDFIELNY